MIDLVELYDPAGRAQQSRAARLLLAYLEGDAALSADVFAEASADERGEAIALCALIITLVEGQVAAWTVNATPEQVAAGIRRQLAVMSKEY